MNFSIIIRISPGTPKSPQIAAVTIFIPIKNPVLLKSELKMKRPRPPKAEFRHNKIIALKGFLNIRKINITIKAAIR